ncbi:class I SAM-dependent methyltransferase [Nocardia sp. NPDC004604]|uniref:class I SAM-dependent methyltransferase n=1 Tax=Nocardia sp. NPDC004604 TaxID=3157013 RepID=UPI0033AE7F6A
MDVSPAQRFSSPERRNFHGRTGLPGHDSALIFEQAGFSHVKVRSFTGGVAAMHLGYK